ncbi:MAG TPA: hypothetical protein VKB86_16395 [Pyrinomonadaceae bacterium]|nr:hypothetical protein [Pyrinomonadaceae bacterium]
MKNAKLKMKNSGRKPTLNFAFCIINFAFSRLDRSGAAYLG